MEVSAQAFILAIIALLLSAMTACKPDPDTPVECPAGYVYNSSTGQCESIPCTGTCPPGQIFNRVSNQCEPAPPLADHIDILGIEKNQVWAGVLSPALYDLDNDCRLEMILTVQGYLTAAEGGVSYLLILDPYGKVRAKTDFPEQFIADPRGLVAVGTLDGSTPAIVVPSQRDMVVFDRHGKIARTFSTGYFATAMSSGYGSVTLADLDNDGDDEIIFGGTSVNRIRALVAIHGDGTSVSGFPVTLNDLPMVPAVGHLDNLGELAIVVAENNISRTQVTVQAFRANAKLLWKAEMPEETLASPVIGDIDGDGDGEVVLTTAFGLHVWDSDGRPMVDIQMGRNKIHTDPALADLNSDGRLEIIFGYYPTLYVVTADGTRLVKRPMKWPMHPMLAVDLDGDQHLDIAANEDYMLSAWNRSGNELTGFPWSLGAMILYSAPSVGDLDGDGRLELVTSSLVPGAEDNWARGRIHIRTLDASIATPAALAWPCYRQNVRRTGSYPCCSPK